MRCDEGDYDATAQTCADPYWAQDTGFLPPLDAGEALLIAGAIGSCWMLGYYIRQLKSAASR